MNSIFDIPTNYSSSGNAYVSQEIQDKWPTYEFLGKPIRLGNGKTYMRAYTRGLPSNVKAVGYIEDYWILNSILNQCDAFVNFSFRDAGCKCVSQAVNVGLPVLYTNSGGVPELVGLYGAGIPDYDVVNCPSFISYTPALNFEHIARGYYDYKHLYNRFIDFRVPHNYLRDTIGKYFSEIRKVVDK